ncbi:ABC transporter permease subunit [Bradyrhizobium sp. LHD-71]|uniref:ABC transporter permease n=1 Tax=Bradyrhizobium sp. LHD-71 TaxID=3072141 RepID=UPI00280CA77D|nr:ABC transporter permease subunit [Bradyrhizobium sp. LHD-71]MDQ8728485.1 ABC transporter permease subunit [Bradyrhizobium sp. LHD-71]
MRSNEAIQPSVLLRWGDGLLVLLAIIASWQALALWGGSDVMTTPIETVRHAVQLTGQSRFWPHFRETATAYSVAAIVAVLGGLLMGIALGAHRLTGEVFEPIFVALYSIPKVTLYPVVLLLFGLGIEAKIAFGAMHGIIPVTIFTLNAVRQVNRTWLRAGRAMGLSPAQSILHIVVPATIPEIVSGIRIGLSLALLGTMLGELFASKRGLGFLLMSAIDVHDVRTIMAIALLISIFAWAMNAAMLAIDRRLHQRI